MGFTDLVLKIKMRATSLIWILLIYEVYVKNMISREKRNKNRSWKTAVQEQKLEEKESETEEKNLRVTPRPGNSIIERKEEPTSVKCCRGCNRILMSLDLVTKLIHIIHKTFCTLRHTKELLCLRIINIFWPLMDTAKPQKRRAYSL
jgi:hypothetical protein